MDRLLGGPARGAYATRTGTIYLNGDWLAGASRAAVLAVLTEELGHHLDALLNTSDTPGDEGELFAAVLTGGGAIPAGPRQALVAEADQGRVLVGGEELAVEMAARVVSVPVAARYWGASGTSGEYGNQRAIAVLRSNGSVVSWGDPDDGGDSRSVAAQLSSGVVQVYSNSGAFAALKRDGSVVTWGRDFAGGSPGIFAIAPNGSFNMQSSVADQLASGVVKVFSSPCGFAALKSDGSVVTWGWVRALSSPGAGVSDIVSNSSGFAALASNGSVLTDYPTGQEDRLAGGVVRIFANDGAFAALKADGSVVVWGDRNSGGSLNLPQLPLLLSSGVVQIIPTATAFAALKNDGSVVAWGIEGAFARWYSSYGTYYYDYDVDLAAQVSGSRRTSSEVTQIVSSGRRFAALKRDGSVIAWGAGDSHRLLNNGVVVRVEGQANTFFARQIQSGARNILTTTNAFAVLKSDGSVVTWGTGPAADISAVAARLSSGVSQIFSTDDAYAALKSDGSVVVWGEGAAADTSAVAAKLTSGVVQILATRYTFIALKNDGSVVTWGESFFGGNSSAVASQLVDVVAFANPFTDDRLILDAELPAITLTVAPASVAEDSAANLLYTFTRSGPIVDPLTVNYIVGGTASLGTDYTGIAGTSATKTVTFAAGSAIITVTVDPTADTLVHEGRKRG